MFDISAHIKKFQKELNAGTFSLILLSVLSRSTVPLYGYQISKMLEKKSQDTPIMKQGTLYPVLRSLEEKGLLESTVEPSISGPPRKYYKITENGHKVLVEWFQIWIQTRNFIDINLKG